MGLGGVFGGCKSTRYDFCWFETTAKAILVDINDTLGWRYAFFIQLPFIIVAGIVGTIMINVPVKKTTTAKIKRVDFLGAFTLVAALVLLLLGLNSGGNIVPWCVRCSLGLDEQSLTARRNHPLVYVSLPLSFVFLLIFVYVEDRVASEPIIPVRLILHQSVAAGCLTMFFETMSVFALIYYGPIFFQVVRGVSSTRAGTLFIPQAAGTAMGSLGSGMTFTL
jgi:hypothetical protein